jgi:hypothetical protein
MHSLYTPPDSGPPSAAEIQAANTVTTSTTAAASAVGLAKMAADSSGLPGAGYGAASGAATAVVLTTLLGPIGLGASLGLMAIGAALGALDKK